VDKQHEYCQDFVSEREQVKHDLAIRTNKGKLNYTFLPANALYHEARIWHKNAKENGGKYEKDQWKKLWGADTESIIMQSSWRHFMAIHSGEIFDKETGEYHASCLRANMAMLIEFYVKNNILPKDEL